MKICQQRGAGVLLPVTALPSPYGIGTLGAAAYRFIDRLKQAGQTYWQVLPIGPTGFGNSPYQSYSAFAGNPYLIDLDNLVMQGLLKTEDISMFDWGRDSSVVSYDKITEHRRNVLRLAYENSHHLYSVDYLTFCHEQQDWLEDYALFMACKHYFQQKEWMLWDKQVKERNASSLMNYRILLKDEIDFWKFCQFEFYRQWHKMKQYANENGIAIIGDIPIYVAMDSADVWANSTLFQLDENKKPIAVAGVPPDAFSSQGQMWGNPLYNWTEMEKTNYDWWKKRMVCCAALYDKVRIDHFIGIVRYYTIPAEEKNAVNGTWQKGPGEKLMNAIHTVLDSEYIIVEDLGVLVDEVISLRHKMGYPGMKVLQFGFDGNPYNEHLPHNFQNSMVVYSGTHDNETIIGYFTNHRAECIRACKYFHVNALEELPEAFMRGLYGSVADIAILQMQDILGLSNTARMNIPSTIGSNWQWRLCQGQFTEEIANKMKQLAHIYGR